MSSKITMVEPLDTVRALGDVKGFSTADSALLKKAFPQSPIYDGILTDDSATAEYQTVLSKPASEWDGSNSEFPGFTPKFPLAPDIESVKTGGGGKPATPFVPNVASPGVGSVNPTDLPDPPNAGQKATNTVFGAGASDINPSKTSGEIGKVTLGDWLMSDAGAYAKSMYTGD